jgi:2,5-diketo-D-gluconate reductase A
VRTALEVGYRHIDTAQMYKNEQGVGRAIREVDIDRADVHVTSKLDNGFHKPDDARRAFDDTLDALGSDYGAAGSGNRHDAHPDRFDNL